MTTTAPSATLVACCRPYNSPLLGAALVQTRTPVLWTDDGTMPWRERLAAMDMDAVERRWGTAGPRLLTTLEGCLDPLTVRFPAWSCLAGAALCKDKARFRAATAAVHPGLGCAVLTTDRIFTAEELARRPQVVKPVRGISSEGVRVLRRGPATVAASPASPMLVEDLLEGPELAVDGYFDADGTPVILGILAHDFADDEDVSDTVYRTSRSVVRTHRGACTRILADLNRHLGLRDFPFHYELRIDPRRGPVSIELNPLRFAGYGTCEIGWWAFGIDPYRHFIDATAPDWDGILAGDGDEADFAVVAIPRGRDDLRAIASGFAQILEVRPLPDPQAAAGALVLVREPDPARMGTAVAAWRP